LREIPGVVPPLHLLGRGCAFAERCAAAMPRCVDAAPPEVARSDSHRAACWLLDAPATALTEAT
jgi:oligopeptide/dipeptide ABC transporter ATP-binding protein